MRASISLLIAILLVGCAARASDHCPPKTAVVYLQCKEALAKGEKTKEQCYQEIEESCP